MSYKDFCLCTPDEFQCVCKAFNEQRETDFRNQWEQTRVLWSVEAQTHSTKKINPLDAMPFAWDKKEQAKHIFTKKDKQHSRAVFHFGEHY